MTVCLFRPRKNVATSKFPTKNRRHILMFQKVCQWPCPDLRPFSSALISSLGGAHLPHCRPSFRFQNYGPQPMKQSCSPTKPGNARGRSVGHSWRSARELRAGPGWCHMDSLVSAGLAEGRKNRQGGTCADAARENPRRTLL